MLIHLSIEGHTNVKHSNLNGKESWFNLTFMYIKDHYKFTIGQNEHQTQISTNELIQK